MPQRICQRPDRKHPCTCAMGNLYRFVEPVVLLLLKKKHRSYGYDLSADLQECTLTDAEIERGALYRTLRRLEANGNVRSEWETDRAGPARRVYKLTAKGERHLNEWAAVLEHGFEIHGPLRQGDQRSPAAGCWLIVRGEEPGQSAAGVAFGLISGRSGSSTVRPGTTLSPHSRSALPGPPVRGEGTRRPVRRRRRRGGGKTAPGETDWKARHVPS